MKKYRKVFQIALVCVTFSVFLFLGQNSWEAKGEGHKKALRPLLSPYLTGEDTIAVNGDTVHQTTANGGWTLMNSSLFIYHGGSNIVLDSGDNKIDTSYLRNLYDTAYKKRTGSHYVTVLQIKYGVHAHSIKLYYKPLCLTRDSSNTVGGTLYGYYSNHNKFDSNYYSYSAQGFTRVPYKNQFLVDSLSYIDSIRIRHHSGGSIGTFYTLNNDSGDIHSVIYSFQEVYALINANPNSAYFKVSNIGITVTVQVGGMNKYFTKHGLLIGPNDLPPSKSTTVSGSGVYYNVYADLEHLCPPDCSETQYQLQ